MKLNIFNGGINTGVAPHLIKPNEAVDVKNLDVSAGHMKSRASDLVASGTTNSNYACLWHGTNYDRMLPLSNIGSQAIYYTYYRGLAVTSDTGSSLTVSPYIAADRVGSNGFVPFMLPSPTSISYSVSHTPTPENGGDNPYTGLGVDSSGVCGDDLVDINLVIESTPNGFSVVTGDVLRYEVWLEISGRHYKLKTVTAVAEATVATVTATVTLNVHSREFLRDVNSNYTNATAHLVRYGDTSALSVDSAAFAVGVIVLHDAKLAGSTTQITELREGDMEDGTYSYAITTYDPRYGYESPPLLLEGVRVFKYGACTVYFDTESSPYNTRIYRIGGLSSEWGLVGEWRGGGWLDTKHSNDLGSDILQTQDNLEPFRVTYIEEHKDILFAVPEEHPYIVRFSSIVSASHWNQFAHIRFRMPITGIKSTDSGLVVFTATSTHMLIGTSTEDMYRVDIDDRIGCIGHNTIANYNNMVMWLSEEGLHSMSNSRPKNISKLTIPNFTPSIAGSTYDASYDYLVPCEPASWDYKDAPSPTAPNNTQYGEAIISPEIRGITCTRITGVYTVDMTQNLGENFSVGYIHYETGNYVSIADFSDPAMGVVASYDVPASGIKVHFNKAYNSTSTAITVSIQGEAPARIQLADTYIHRTPPIIEFCAIHRECYYMLTPSECIIYDIARRVFTKAGSEGVTLDGIIKSDRPGLEIIADSRTSRLKPYSASEGVASTYAITEYISPLFTEGSPSMLKLYNNFHIRYKGNIWIKVYINGLYASEYEGLDAQSLVYSEFKIPIKYQRGYNIQFKIRLQGELLELEYNVTGRQGAD